MTDHNYSGFPRYTGPEQGWMQRGACQDVDDTDVMFPDRDRAGRVAAKAICRRCPSDVRAACLEYAIANGERFGIWGGLDEDERRPLRLRWIAEQGLELTVRGRVKSGHATRARYQSGCRCDGCREAQRVYDVARRA